jgi:hypothetical protein
MGVICKHGTNAGSLVPVVVIGPIGVPAGQRHLISDFHGTSASPGANTTLVLQKSNDNFALNIVEVERLELPNPGTFEDSPVGDTLILGGAQVQWRVTAVQSAAGALSATIRGETQLSNGNPGPDVLD